MRSLWIAALVPFWAASGCSTLAVEPSDPCSHMARLADTQSAEPQIIIDKVNKCVAQPEIGPNRLYQALQIRAAQYVNLGNHSAAIEDYQRAAPLKKPQTAWDLISPSIAYREAGQNDEALALLKRATDENLGMTGKDSGWAMPYYYHLGWTLQKMRRYNEALSAYSQGIPYQPDFPGVYWRRGLTYEALANKEAAKADFIMMTRYLEKQAARYKSQTLNENDKKRVEKFRLEYEAKLKEYGLPFPLAFTEKIPLRP